MTLYGLDISNHQTRNGFDVARARREGYEFLTHKMTEGTWFDPCFAAIARQALEHFPGRFGGYVYCRVDTDAETEADTVVQAARRAGLRPGDFALQIDYEDTVRAGSAWDLTVRVRAHQARGWDLLPIYLPRWYWSGYMGSADLSHLPVGLWNSNYVNGAGPAARLYPGDGYAGWNSFAGLAVQILQFSEQGSAAGESPIDLNAFRGTPAELDRMFRGGTTMADDKADAILLQELGPDEAGKPRGWPAQRYHLAPDDQPRHSQTDFLRAIDAKTNSELPAVGDEPNPRPKPLDEGDDLFGHVLSLRAQLAQTQEMLMEIGRGLRDPDYRPGGALLARLHEITEARR